MSKSYILSSLFTRTITNMFSLNIFKTQCYRFFRLFTGFIIFLVFFHSNFASASEIVSVQSINIQPYNDALSSFQNNCNCDVKQFIISEMYGDDVVMKIQKAEPELIIAIGMKALESVSEIKDVPIVSMLVLNPQSIIANNDNITAIDLFIPPIKQLSEIMKVIPHIKTIGLLFDPVKTGNYIKDAKIASKSLGIRLIAKEVQRSKDVPSILQSMKGNIDAYWMIPDLTVVTPDTVEFLSLFSIENNIPIITFSRNYFNMGALISLDIDSADMGRQAWEIADRILSGTLTKHIKMSYTRTLNVSINHKTVKNFGMIAVNNMLIRAVAENR